MKNVCICWVTVVTALLAQTVSAEVPADIPVLDGDFTYVVCSGSPATPVSGPNLTTILFSAQPLEQVKPIQSWGKAQPGFTLVRFPNRTNPQEFEGWIEESLVKPKGLCAQITPATKVSTSVHLTSPNRPKATLIGANCCEFPTRQPPTADFTAGQRRFGAARTNRLHAACDLYRIKDEDVLAIAPGTVIRDKYYFYQGTYALEVRHEGGFVVRYGEVTGKGAMGVKRGKTVAPGQAIGYIGKVNSNCCNPMLHFELYSGSATGPLTQSGTAFDRRRDLIDPSHYLLDWQKAKFHN